ncbi:MAG: hypothetical protein AB7N76_33485 [Planctomycetota bacterium]
MAAARYSAEVVERARALHAASPVTDLHADTFIAVRGVLGENFRRTWGEALRCAEALRELEGART